MTGPEQVDTLKWGGGWGEVQLWQSCGQVALGARYLMTEKLNICLYI